MASLREEQVVRRAGLMVWFQSVVIFLLLVWMSMEYNHNQYFQAWAVHNLGALRVLLNGTGAGFYGGMLVAIFVFRTLPGVMEERARDRRRVGRGLRGEEVVVSAEAV